MRRPRGSECSRMEERCVSERVIGTWNDVSTTALPRWEHFGRDEKRNSKMFMPQLWSLVTV